MEEPSGAMGCFSQLLHMPHEVCAGIVWSLGVEDTAKLASSCKLFAQETLALKVQEMNVVCVTREIICTHIDINKVYIDVIL